MKKLTKEMVAKMFTARTGDAIKGYKFAVIAGDAELWYDESNPAARLNIVGFFDDKGEVIESTDELLSKATREIRSCGEFADMLAGRELDYISIGK